KNDLVFIGLKFTIARFRRFHYRNGTGQCKAEFLSVPGQVSLVHAKIKTLDALLSIISKVTEVLDSPPKNSPRPEGELIKKDKGKHTMSSKDAEKEGIESEYDNSNLTVSKVESSKLKKLKQFDFITEGGEHIHLTADQIKEQKKLEELAKADMAKQEVELGKRRTG
nr:hypothetical protein [Tanacetum cinerariifolium]